MFATLRKITLALAILTISISSFAGTAIKRAVVIDGKTYEKWVLNEENIKTVTIIDPASGDIVKETVTESYDDQSVVTTYKELNDGGKLVVVRIKYSTLDNKKTNDDGSVSYEYKDVTKDAEGNVVSTGTTTTTTKTVTDGKTGSTTTSTSTTTTSTDSDGNSETESSTTSTETDTDGGVTETVTEKDNDGKVTETTTVQDKEGNSKSETTDDNGNPVVVEGESGDQPGDDGDGSAAPDSPSDPAPSEVDPHDPESPHNPEPDGSPYDGENNN